MSYRTLHTCREARPGDDGYQLDALGQPAHIATLPVSKVERVTLGWRWYGRRCDGDPIIDCVGSSGPMPVVGPVPKQEVLL